MNLLDGLQRAMALLIARCDNCGEERYASLTCWVSLNEHGQVVRRTGSTVYMVPDSLTTSRFIKDFANEDREVAIHWEPLSDEDREEQFMSLLKSVHDFYEMGIYTAEDAFGIMWRYVHDSSRDLKKCTCGTFDFFDEETGQLVNIPYILEMSDASDVFASIP